MRLEMTEGQRDKLVRESLKRFKRDPRKPDDLEKLRYNLIVARVMTGLTVDEAEQKLNVELDASGEPAVNLEQLEGGRKTMPGGYRFFWAAALTYSCSVDFLLGLSPHLDESARVAHEHAMARSLDGLGRGIAKMLSNVIAKHTEQAHPVASEYRRTLTAVERLESAIAVMRDRFGFDEVLGSAPVLVAVEQLSAIAEPFREKLRHFQNVEAYIEDVKAGRMPAIPHLSERHARAHRPDGIWMVL